MATGLLSFVLASVSLRDAVQIGRAVAAILSLPVKPEAPLSQPCLASFRNRVVYINSFTVSQRDMLASALRVTGAKEEDWTVKNEPAQARFVDGPEEMQEGRK